MAWVTAIIVAAGEGKRFGSLKQFSFLKGKKIIDWTLEAFESHESVNEIIVVLNEEWREREIKTLYGKVKAVVKGGKKRQDSVRIGFNQIDPDKNGVVLVHDGARPLIKKELISRIIQKTRKEKAAIPVVPEEDTVKKVKQQIVCRTLDRKNLFRVQTPQGFLYQDLKDALDWADKRNYCGTDEASLFEKMGKKVAVVEGDPINIKITFPHDVKIAEALLEG